MIKYILIIIILFICIINYSFIIKKITEQLGLLEKFIENTDNLNQTNTNLNQTNNIKLKHNKLKKLDYITPKLSNTLNTKNDIINYLFSIQDFYAYNPIVYQNIVEHLDIFFIRYDELMRNNSMAGNNYDVMDNEKRNIMNALNSIIFSLVPNKKYDNKLKHSIDSIDNILNKYMNNVEYINNKYIYDNGIKNKTKFIFKSKVKPLNTYNDTIFSYDIV
jgi:hypothetical protein